MTKQIWKSGTMLYPLPAVLVSCAHGGQDNVFTVAWTGIVCTNPAQTYVSVRPERYSYDLIRQSGEFVINLVPSSLARACDLCGVVSGRDGDKFARAGLTREAMRDVNCPGVAECPVQLECRVKQVLELGSHHMFLADILCVHADDALLNDAGKLELERASLISYSHGAYFEPGRALGGFGFSVRKKPPAKAASSAKPAKGERPISGAKPAKGEKTASGKKPEKGERPASSTKAASNAKPVGGAKAANAAKGQKRRPTGRR